MELAENEREGKEKMSEIKGLKFDKVHLDYGGGFYEVYPLKDLCMLEVGTGKSLFSPESQKEMELNPENLYAVLTLENDFESLQVEVRELESDVRIIFLSDDRE